MKEVKLPSGAILKITPSPFAEARALYQAALREFKGINIGSGVELSVLYKELFCTGFSSPEIEAKLWECFKRCTYDNGKGDLKIDAATFEPVDAREDYLSVCMEVAKENVGPFMKSLLREYKSALAMTEKAPE